MVYREKIAHDRQVRPKSAPCRRDQTSLRPSRFQRTAALSDLSLGSSRISIGIWAQIFIEIPRKESGPFRKYDPLLRTRRGARKDQRGKFELARTHLAPYQLSPHRHLDAARLCI